MKAFAAPTIAIAIFSLALGATGCEHVEDIARQVIKKSPESGGPGTKGGPTPPPLANCLSTVDCNAGEVCGVELGQCLPPPGCTKGVCPAVCYGTCQPPKPPQGESCGAATCAAGLLCCNPSCGTCVKPGQACTKEACPPLPPPVGACQTDAECRTFSDYCTGCDCRALGAGEPDPICAGPGVRCFADPCLDKVATCQAGRCTFTAAGGKQCVKRVQGGSTSCKDAATWKRYASDDCVASGLVLSDISYRESCGASDFTRFTDYVCCGR